MQQAVKIAFAGEGVTEYGRGLDVRRSEKEQSCHDGFLQIVLKKAFSERAKKEAEFRVVDRIQWKTLSLHRGDKRGYACSHGAKLALAVRLSEVADADGLVFIIDDDKDVFTEDLHRDLQTLRERDMNIAVAGGTAIRMIEAALLADRNAVSTAFPGLSFPKGKDPEDTVRAKSICKQAFLDFKEKSKDKGIKNTSWGEARMAIFEHVALETLRQKCPRGIGRFVRDLEEVLRLFS